jgi:hypothetical protein
LDMFRKNWKDNLRRHVFWYLWKGHYKKPSNSSRDLDFFGEIIQLIECSNVLCFPQYNKSHIIKHWKVENDASIMKRALSKGGPNRRRWELWEWPNGR